MASDENVDTTRKAVKTFVPAYQKEEWKRHADELDMSQSEFVRTMVQAGRRDFDIETAESESGSASKVDEAGDGEELADHVLSVLSASEYLSWDELVDELTNNIEDRLEESLQRLQSENRIQYSGRRDGYTLVTGNDGD
ncbi:DUF5805 domain-containing protein [Halorussus sp. MSC15.2]|uniref:DUF5805 domain-containing protein n=1 Tax=Halorussus sp. MSC15.2 TaxID=2283638 RepID=UPI0013D03280|nr:DUF5805 domain-containing protein [Halorussus sp. MSC15.2]NEU56978.1 hypothetical protein [Halorussus sp. MSC15.2]